MPKIREYNQQVGAAGPVQFQQLRGSDISAAGGLSAIGKGLSDVSNYIEEREVFEARKDLVNEKLNTREEFEKMQKEAPPGAKDFDKQVNEFLEKRRNKLQEKYSSGEASRFVSQSLDDFQSSMKFEAYKFQAESLGKKDVADVTQAKTRLQNDTRANPNRLMDNVAAQAELIEGMKVDQSTKYQFHKESLAQMYDSALDGTVNKLATSEKTKLSDVERMISEVSKKDGKWASNNSEPEYKKQIAKLEQLRESIKKRDEDDMFADMKEAHAQIAATGTSVKDYGPKWIESNISDPKKKRFWLDSHKLATAEGEAVTFFDKGTNIVDAQKKIEELQDVQNKTPEFFRDNTKLEAMVRVTQARLKEFSEDPAGYTVKYNPIVKANYEKFLETQTPEDFKKFATFAKNKQNQFNPDGTTSVLPKEMLSEFKGVIDSMVTGKASPQDTLAYFEKQKNTIGSEFFPDALRDLERNKIAPTALIVAASISEDPKDKPLAENMIRAASVNIEEARKNLPKGSIEDMREKLSVELAPLRNSISDTVGAFGESSPDNAISKYRDIIEKTAIQMAPQNGETVASMASKITKQLINEKYEFVNSGEYRIPKTVNTTAIRRAARTFQSLLRSEMLVTPLTDSAGRTPEETKAAYRTRLIQNGRWRTLSDDSGMELVDPNRSEVKILLDGEERPARFTWQELEVMHTRFLGGKGAGVKK
jgi:hypothetical protein